MGDSDYEYSSPPSEDDDENSCSDDSDEAFFYLPQAKRARTTNSSRTAARRGQRLPTFAGATAAAGGTVAASFSHLSEPQRRFLLLATVTIVVLLCMLAEVAGSMREQHTPSFFGLRHRGQFGAFAARLERQGRFKRYFRIEPQRFRAYVAAITPDDDTLARMRAQGNRRPGGFVEFDVRLALMLRYMAGGSYLDIMYLFGIEAPGTFYNLVWDTMVRLDSALPALSLEEDLKDLDRCRTLAQGFAREGKTDGNIRGCIGALDGLLLQIEAPPFRWPNRVKYLSRKGFWAVNVQAWPRP